MFIDVYGIDDVFLRKECVVSCDGCGFRDGEFARVGEFFVLFVVVTNGLDV